MKTVQFVGREAEMARLKGLLWSEAEEGLEKAGCLPSLAKK